MLPNHLNNTINQMAIKAKKYLSNSAFTQNSNGYIDIIRYRVQPYLNDATGVTAFNALIEAIRDERNNIHTLLNDGITDGAMTIVAGTSDDGGKLRYITQELITCILSDNEWGTGLVTDQTKIWLNITGVKEVEPKTPLFNGFGDFVGEDNTLLLDSVGDRTTAFDLRAITIAAAFACWDAIDSL
jgi:hypothetical protein